MHYFKPFKLSRTTSKALLLLLAGGSLIACLSAKQAEKKHPAPPGTVRISSNFFCDKAECANIYWGEYQYWVKRVFGLASSQYRATLLDSSVWQKKDSCLATYVRSHLMPLSLDFYPLVGVSQQQAEAFAHWRSDRVLERMLILRNKIKIESNQTPENCFTIEKYFAGKYQNVQPDTNIFYPDYRLPTIDEYRMVLHLADSLNKNRDIKIQAGIVPCAHDTFKTAPTVFVATQQDYKKQTLPLNLRGNVSEWAAEKNVSLGGGWADSKQAVLTQDSFNTQTQNAWTGFRNVCEWKKWEKK